METRMIVVGGVCLAVGIGIGLWFGGARIQEERARAYQRGRDAGLEAAAQFRRRHLAVVRDEDATVLTLHAESRGPRRA